jgi:hypothetical protein
LSEQGITKIVVRSGNVRFEGKDMLITGDGLIQAPCLVMSDSLRIYAPDIGRQNSP